MTAIRDLSAAARDALYLFCDGPISQRAINDAARQGAGRQRSVGIPTGMNELRAEIALTERALDGNKHDIRRVRHMPQGIRDEYEARARTTMDRLRALDATLADLEE